MKELSWDDLRLFLHVAESGGLSGAARRTGLSAPTVGRRMLALEQRTGRTLFERSQTGYALTASGAALTRRVRAMRAASVPVFELLASDAEKPQIRLSAGTGTAAFLADRFRALSRPDDDFRLNFITTESMLDVAHRQVDLGVRNRPADAGNLASRKLGTLNFAPYRSWSVARPEALDWVAMHPEDARHKAANWVHRQGHPIRVFASSVGTVHQLVRAGAGVGVMPCMIGDADPTLARAGPVIDELTEAQFAVMHADDRHRPPIRRVVERLAAIYRDDAELLAGRRAIRS